MAAEGLKCCTLWLLLWLCFQTPESKTARSLDDDLLQPYSEGHGPTHSHRHVRDCQALIHGNSTHESWPSSNSSRQPVAESNVFVTDVEKGTRWVLGHLTVVHDPLQTVSVVEPGGLHGCGTNRRVSVEETATAAGCIYAQNAGFFNMEYGECLGNVVSDGRLVRDSGGVQNAQFGIRQDGTLVFGYLSQEDVLNQTNPFVQLISGVIWLLRDGQVYINQSLEAECSETQSTGSLRYFVDVVSARTAVGHDKEGRLILFHIDGQTDRRGMNLWQVADFLKENGVINAINLDGGGSSTYVINGSLASYPSDHCKLDGRWRCAREVSTVLCVHQRRCNPANCSSHRDCVDGQCRCQTGWRGPACNTLVCQPSACGPHGVCSPSGCVCKAGWRGTNCSEVCPLGFFGSSCTQECRCDDLCPCDPQTGSCNTSLPQEANYTLHRAGHCLAKKMFTSWGLEEEALRAKPYLTEQTWLIITLILTSLLLATLLVPLLQTCRGSVASRFPERQDYSYVPLRDINGAAAETGNSGTGGLGLEDSDSQEDIFTQRS
ncbi:N-acetylglucosamine-1-phosphodiester alpha-N-acetylglucosaminidase isoform X2 [Cyprinodon tularosa]|uniref:N-acetylglucosamine-1-phosphodiester alpha-N-acetylglucosaminidase isoform X2 n=1 Tax=Cyprinodon tularosa TaxID=77115 RepID=UPI0018E22790|nr:N-acetylglucosamine-1-phosphodiester alpha-N-acetylglucosaminidase isoform X2 [Cyprinodon tularosa]